MALIPFVKREGLSPRSDDTPHDRDELVALPERRVAARDLDADPRPVRRSNPVDPVEDDLERDVLHGFGAQ